MKRGRSLALLAAAAAGVALFATSNAACGSRDWARYEDDLDQRLPEKPQAPAAAESPVTFAVLNTGHGTSPKAFVFEGGSLFESADIQYAAILLKHPQGALLFDTGLGTRIDEEVADNSFIDRKTFAYTKGKPVIEQLRAASFPVESISAVVLSHLHWDHASGLRDLPEVPVLVPEEERRGAQAGKRPVFIAAQLDIPESRFKPLTFPHGPYENFARSNDFYGDGSVVLVPLPGHTAGSLGMFVRTATRRLFFVGDLTWSLEALKRPADRPGITRGVVDADEEGVRRAIAKVHRLMRARPDLVVVPAHDAGALSALPQFPAFGP